MSHLNQQKYLSHISLNLFNHSQRAGILLFCSSILLSFAVLSIWGGFSVLLISAICMFITVPIVSYCSKLIRLKGLLLGFIMAVTYKTIFLISKLLVLNENPSTALIINDAAGYISSAYNPNIGELLTFYGTDIGYVLFLKYLVNIFNVLSMQVPIVLVVPNIFAGSLIMVFAVMLACTVIPTIHPRYVFWLAALDPMLANYSTVVLKDILVGFLVSVSLVVLIIKKGYFIQIIVWVFATISSFLLRFRSSAIIVGFLGFRIFFNKNNQKRKKSQLISLISIIILSIGLVGFNTNIFSLVNKGKSIIDTEKSHVEKISRKGKVDIRASGRLGLIINNLPTFPLRTAARTIMSFLAPIPPVQFYQLSWGSGDNDIQARLFRDLGGIFWYIMMPFTLLGAMSMLQRKEYTLPLSLFIVLLAMGIGGWVDARIRMMASLPVYILMAEGIANNKFFNRYSIAFYFLLISFWIIYELVF